MLWLPNQPSDCWVIFSWLDCWTLFNYRSDCSIMFSCFCGVMFLCLYVGSYSLVLIYWFWSYFQVVEPWFPFPIVNSCSLIGCWEPSFPSSYFEIIIPMFCLLIPFFCSGCWVMFRILNHVLPVQLKLYCVKFLPPISRLCSRIPFAKSVLAVRSNSPSWV